MFCCMSSVDSVWACAWPYPAALYDLHQTNNFVLALLRIVQAPAPRVQVTMLVLLSAFRDLVRYEDDTPRPLAYTSDHELANEMLGRSHAPCGLYGIATCAHARFMRFAGVHPRELMLSSIWLLFAVPECAAHLEAWCWRVPPLCTRSNPPSLTPTPH